MTNHVSIRHTSYGVKKAVSIEAARRLLDECELGWISTISNCQFDPDNEMICLFGLITNEGVSYIANVTLEKRVGHERLFPISSVMVRVFKRDYPSNELPKVINRHYNLTADGEFVSR